MTSKQRIKGFNYERSIVKQFNDIGWIASRSWGSNGKSSGLPEEVDISTYHPTIEPTSELHPTRSPLWLQCKRIKQLPKWLGMSGKIDAVVMREDNNKSYILLRFDDFLKRFLS